mmetsp:Transcript_61641/g.125145  ORF Transcript_61641/g.125145 Transcript_61641/m.125145 type:complete len:218 (-) Transcript_61641:1598-2251(-)
MTRHLHNQLIMLQCFATLHDANHHRLHQMFPILFNSCGNITASDRTTFALPTSRRRLRALQLHEGNLDSHQLALELRIHCKLVALLRLLLLGVPQLHQDFGLGVDVEAHQMAFQLLQGNVGAHRQVLIGPGGLLVEEHQDAHLVSCHVELMLGLGHLGLDVCESMLRLPIELSTCVLCQVEGFESAAAVLNFRRQLAGGARRAWPKAAGQHRHLQIN